MEIKQHPWFWKSMPREIFEGDRQGYMETQRDQPSQSVEEIMRIVGEARKPGLTTNGADVDGIIEEEFVDVSIWKLVSLWP